jgi:hypothetical protein
MPSEDVLLSIRLAAARRAWHSRPGLRSCPAPPISAPVPHWTSARRVWPAAARARRVGVATRSPVQGREAAEKAVTAPEGAASLPGRVVLVVADVVYVAVH